MILPLLADLLCVLAFALAGKGTHVAGASGWVVLAIAWPYAVAVAFAHGALHVRARDARRIWPAGAVVVVVTYLLGTALRVLSGRGTAGGFLVVSLVFLALTMLGWRGAATWAAHRRSVRVGHTDRRSA